MNFSNGQYLQFVIKEILRAFPPICNIMRMAKEEDQLDGFEIPKAKQLMLNIYLIHRNEEFWPNPEDFKPERFAEYKPSNKLQYMPFNLRP